MKRTFLSPLDIKEPPKHTQIEPKCVTCSKMPVCRIREDYLKTASLIEQILGDPQEDRELREWDNSFSGYDFENFKEIFPETIEVTSSIIIDNITTNLINVRYRDKDNIKLLYDISKYLVVFSLIWKEEDSNYIISDGKEIYYGIPFKIENFEFDSTKLLEWREEQIKKEEESKDIEIINTTYFSAILNCKFYSKDNISYNEGVQRLCAQIEEDPSKTDYAHLSTYHIEPRPVPEIKPTFAPQP